MEEIQEYIDVPFLWSYAKVISPKTKNGHRFQVFNSQGDKILSCIFYDRLRNEAWYHDVTSYNCENILLCAKNCSIKLKKRDKFQKSIAGRWYYFKRTIKFYFRNGTRISAA